MPFFTIWPLLSGSSDPCTNENCHKTGVHPEVNENVWNISGRTSSSSQRGKRHAWEASVLSLKSKRIRGSHNIDDCQDIQHLNSDNVQETSTALKGCSWGMSRLTPLEIIPKDPSEGRLLDHLNKDLILQGNCPRIMFMNIADDAKKTCLAKVKPVLILNTSLYIDTVNFRKCENGLF